MGRQGVELDSGPTRRDATTPMASLDGHGRHCGTPGSTASPVPRGASAIVLQRQGLASVPPEVI
jgi:hypothetical protein